MAYYPALADVFDNCSNRNLDKALKEAQELFISLKAYGVNGVDICGKFFSDLDPDFKSFCCFTAMFVTRTPSSDARFLKYFGISKTELDMRVSSMFPHIYKDKGDFPEGIPFVKFIDDFRQAKLQRKSSL